MAGQWDNNGNTLTVTKLNSTTLVLGSTDVTNAVLVDAAKSTGVGVGTVAAAGSTQTDATPIVGDFCVVTAGDGTKGVLLPAAVIGMTITIKNNSGSNLKVWPAGTAAINAGSASAAFTMATVTCCSFKAQTAAQWWTLPLVAS